MMPIDWWIELISIVMLALIIAQNMGLREKLKDIEVKLDRQK